MARTSEDSAGCGLYCTVLYCTVLYCTGCGAHRYTRITSLPGTIQFSSVVECSAVSHLGGRSSTGIAPLGMFAPTGEAAVERGGGADRGGAATAGAGSWCRCGGPLLRADLSAPDTKGSSSCCWAAASLSWPEIARFSSGPASCSVRSPACSSGQFSVSWLAVLVW